MWRSDPSLRVGSENPNFPSDVDLFGSQMARSVGRPVASRGFSPVRPIRVVSVGAPAATATVPRNFCSKLCQLSSESDNAACNRAPGWQMKRCRHQKLSFFFQKQCCTIYKQKKKSKMQPPVCHTHHRLRLIIITSVFKGKKEKKISIDQLEFVFLLKSIKFI